MPPKDMLTASDAAELAGITPASLHSYRSRGTFPEPDGHFGITPFWYRKTVEAWIRRRRPPGRPAKKR